MNEYKTIRVFLMAIEQALIERHKNRQKNKGEKIIRKIKQEIKPLDEDLIIDTTKKDVEEIKQIILRKLKEYERNSNI